MFANKLSNRRRFAAVAVLALTVLATACSDTNPPDIESLNLAISADIQAGTTFEVAVPEKADTSIRVKTTPAGVTAAITDGPEAGTIVLTVNVEFDTPRGAYNLGLSVVRDGEEYEVGWPFEVVDPGGAAPSPGPVSTTQLAATEAVLTVDTPVPGGLMVSSDLIRGFTSAGLVGYRLSAGGSVLDEGTLTTVEGHFESPIVFTNTCCIEMLLEVFNIGDGGLAVTIPLSYPESS